MTQEQEPNIEGQPEGQDYAPGEVPEAPPVRAKEAWETLAGATKSTAAGPGTTRVPPPKERSVRSTKGKTAASAPKREPYKGPDVAQDEAVLKEAEARRKQIEKDELSRAADAALRAAPPAGDDDGDDDGDDGGEGGKPVKVGTLRGVVFVDAEETNDPSGQQRLPGAVLELMLDGTKLPPVQAGKKGKYSVDVPAGRIAVKPLPVTANGFNYEPLAVAPSIQVEAGRSQRFDVPYRVSPAKIIVDALYQPPNKPRKKAGPLDGVTFELVGGPTAAGRVLRRDLTQNGDPVTFSDLPGGWYTVRMSGHPQTFRGKAIGLHNPAATSNPIYLQPGQVFDLRGVFEFRSGLGTAGGIITDAQGRGLAGIEVGLTPASKQDNLKARQTRITGANGQFEFDNLQPGVYIVRLDNVVTDAQGQEWTAMPGSPQECAVTVEANRMSPVPQFRLQPDIHRIYGEAIGADGKSIGGLLLLFLDENGTQVGSVTTNPDGTYDWTAPRAGDYMVTPAQTAAGLPLQVHRVSVHSTAYLRIPVMWPQSAVSGTGGTPPVSSDVSESVVDLTTYPLLTETVMYPPSAGPAAGGGGAAGGALGPAVEGALRQVLGWRPKSGDARGFLAALTGAFNLSQREGHTEYAWTPRGYAVQADMGMVTGAQASIYARAKVALDQSLPLINGLAPLRADVLQQDLDAMSAIVSSEFSELVGELGVEGGPRVQRVEELFSQLLGFDLPTRTGATVPAVDPETVLGQLGEVRDRFGLTRSRVNTVEDEQNFTNYIMLVDYISGLANSWLAVRRYFDRTGSAEPFLGTQLVLLSRALDVIAESVQETYFTMDSVFLGDAERQTIELQFTGGQPSLFVSELLDWIDRVASDEGPRLIQDSGKDGVIAFSSVLTRLTNLATQALIKGFPGGQQLPDRMPRGYRTDRVQESLRKLSGQLQEATNLAGQITNIELPKREEVPDFDLFNEFITWYNKQSKSNPKLAL